MAIFQGTIFTMYRRSLLYVHARWTPCEIRPRPLPTTVPEPRLLVAFDLDQSIWVARSNAGLARSMFGAVTGSAFEENAQLILVGNDRMVFSNYFSNGAPRQMGPCFRGTQQAKAGATAYAFESSYQRYNDPSIMTVEERLAEMFDAAVRSPELRRNLQQEFHGMLDPAILIPLAGTFAAIFGAQFVGGAAAAQGVARLLGAGQLICDLQEYAPLGQAIHTAAISAHSPRDLEYGSQCMAKFLERLIMDAASALGIKALSLVAAKLMRVLATCTPDSVREACLRYRGVAEAYFMTHGYKGRKLLKRANDAKLEPSLVKTYKESSIEHRDAIVIREPDSARQAWVASEVWYKGKPCMIKAKSHQGFHGALAIPKDPATGMPKLARDKAGNIIQTTPGKPWNQTRDFDTAGLKGVTPAMDADLRRLGPTRTTYEMPKDWILEGIDYGYTGANHIELDGLRLVDMGDRFLIVDRLGIPFAGDVDVVTRHRQGMRLAAGHLENKGEPLTRAHPEDDYMLQYDLNDSHYKKGGKPFSAPSQHGGLGSVVHVRVARANKKGHWGPKDDSGRYADERLIIFLPEYEKGKGVVSNMYVIDSWMDFEQFARENKWEFPW